MSDDPKKDAEIVRFARLVQTMRQRQAEYFSQRSRPTARPPANTGNLKRPFGDETGSDGGTGALIMARAAEKAVDNAVAWVLEHRANGSGATEPAGAGELFPAMGVASSARPGAYPAHGAREPPPVEEDGSEIPHVL